MSRLLSESFDRWASGSAMTAANVWNSVGSFTAVAAANTQFTKGQGASNFAGTMTFKTAANEATIYGTIRCKYASATPAAGSVQSFSLRDTATDQCTIQLLGDGSTVVRSGGVAGTILNSTAAAFTLNIWNSIQFKVVIHNTTGSVELRLNGSATPFVNLSNVNTRGGTTNAYATAVNIVSGGTTWQLDDLLFVNGDATAPTGWLGDVRCIQQLPLLTTQSQMSVVGPTRTLGGTLTGNSLGVGANTLYFSTSYTMGTRNQVVQKGTFALNAGVTGNIKMVIYSNASGQPGTLVAASNAVNNPVLGDNTFTFASPPTLLANTIYWVGTHTDVAYSAQAQSGGSQAPYSQTATYTSGPPTTAACSAGGQNWVQRCFLTLLNTSASEMADDVTDGDTSYAAGVAGQTDIVSMNTLGATPATILFYSGYVSARKTDAGTVTLTASINHAASGGGSATVLTMGALATSYQYYEWFSSKQADGTSPLSLAAVEGALISLAVT